MSTPDLWVEKYRPANLSGYVFKNESIREQVQDWIDNPSGKTIPFPHLLLSGSPGTGKTSLAKALLNELGVDKFDIMEINGSRINKVEDMRDLITGYCSTYPNGDYKVVLIDEADYLTPNAQAVLRNEMERFNESVRFILTCNLPHKIMGAIHSRVQGFHFDALDMESYINRLVTILTAEGVEFDPDHLDPFINNSYPDLRKCIGLLDQHTRNGTLRPLSEGVATSLNYMSDAVVLFRARRYTDARKLIVANADVNDYEEIYKFLYKNLQLFSDSEAGQNDAIVVIAKGLRNHVLVADPEINLAATFVELSQIQ
jgi:replication factor C small subunit